MALTAITDQLYRIEPAFGQCYLWRDGDTVTLVDSGPPGSGPVIEAALAELGLATAAVARLVLTHSHVDHAGSAAHVRAWGAEVLAHPLDAPVVRGEVPEPQPDLLPVEQALAEQIGIGATPATPPCAVDNELADGDELPFGGGARVVHGPGHTPGSVALHLPGAGVLFTGDTVAEQNGALLLGPFNIDRDLAAQSFRLLTALDADVACFGHGEPVVSGAGGRLRAVADLGPFRG